MSDAAIFAISLGVTLVGLVISWGAYRRRGAGTGMRGAALSLVPLAAAMTGVTEFFVDLAYAVPLNPSLSVHYDFDAGKGSYTTLGLQHELPSHLTFGTNLFYQSHYYAMTGLVSAEFKISASFPLGGLTVTHSGSYFTTWENGGFRGEAAIPAKWLVAINVAR